MEIKLLVFTENYQKGGGNKYLIDIVHALQSNFYKLTSLDWWLTSKHTKLLI